MKKIKTFEDFEKTDIHILMSDFKKGDLVKLKDIYVDGNKNSSNGDIFEIIDTNYSDNRKYNTLKSLRSGFVRSWTLDSSIRHLTEDEKLEQTANKYNL